MANVQQKSPAPKSRTLSGRQGERNGSSPSFPVSHHRTMEEMDQVAGGDIIDDVTYGLTTASMEACDSYAWALPLNYIEELTDMPKDQAELDELKGKDRSDAQ